MTSFTPPNPYAPQPQPQGPLEKLLGDAGEAVGNILGGMAGTKATPSIPPVGGTVGKIVGGPLGREAGERIGKAMDPIADKAREDLQQLYEKLTDYRTYMSPYSPAQYK